MKLRALLGAAALAALAGCASTSDDPRDPLEGMNRAVYLFNDQVDQIVLAPAARLYKNVTPDPLREMVRNFFNNLDDLFIGANNLLQGKLEEAVNDWGRFAFNTVFGVLGVWDVASEMGLEKHNEDFGQTLGRWGVGNGVYLVLPLLGPSTLRDTAALPADWAGDPVAAHRPVDEGNSLTAFRVVARRTDLLGASDTLAEGALDKYQFHREAFLQRRRSLVYDGSAPRERPPAD